LTEDIISVQGPKTPPPPEDQQRFEVILGPTMLTNVISLDK